MFYEIKDSFTRSLISSMCQKTASMLTRLEPNGEIIRYYECNAFTWDFRKDKKWEEREVLRLPDFGFSIAWNGLDGKHSEVLVNQKDFDVKKNVMGENENGEIEEINGLDRFVEMELTIYDHIQHVLEKRFQEEFSDKLPPKDEDDRDCA